MVCIGHFKMNNNWPKRTCFSLKSNAFILTTKQPKYSTQHIVQGAYILGQPIACNVYAKLGSFGNVNLSYFYIIVTDEVPLHKYNYESRDKIREQ